MGAVEQKVEREEISEVARSIRHQTTVQNAMISLIPLHSMRVFVLDTFLASFNHPARRTHPTLSTNLVRVISSPYAKWHSA